MSRLQDQLRRTAVATAGVATTALLALLPVSVTAQTVYRCGPGQYSATPCPDKAGGGTNTVATATSKRPTPSVNDPEAFYDYLSPPCQRIVDGMRSAQSKRMYDTMRELRKEWDRVCQEEGQEALMKYVRDRRDARDQAKEERNAELRAKAQAKEERAQCDEMLRILAAKRKRPNMTDGEKADLKRFEDNYHGRCGAG